jgi:hypothetical protein
VEDQNFSYNLVNNVAKADRSKVFVCVGGSTLGNESNQSIREGGVKITCVEGLFN